MNTEANNQPQNMMSEEERQRAWSAEIERLQCEIATFEAREIVVRDECTSVREELADAREALEVAAGKALSKAADTVTKANARLSILDTTRHEVQAQITSRRTQIAEIQRSQTESLFMDDLVALCHKSTLLLSDFDAEHAELAALIDAALGRLLDLREQHHENRRAFISKAGERFPELMRPAWSQYQPDADSPLNVRVRQFGKAMSARGASLDVLRCYDPNERQHAVYEGVGRLLPPITPQKMPCGEEVLALVELAQAARTLSKTQQVNYAAAGRAGVAALQSLAASRV